MIFFTAIMMLIKLTTKQFCWQKGVGFIILLCCLNGTVNSTYAIEKQWQIEENFCGHQQLLTQYAPVLFFHEREKYFPISVESFLDHAVLMERRFFWPFDRVIQKGDITAELLEEYNSQAYYLKINRGFFESIEKHYLEVKDKYPVTVYANALAVKNNSQHYYILQYWFFYWASEAGNTQIVWHELDWEMVMFKLDQNKKPLQAGFSQHYYGRVIDWDQLEFIQGQPVVYTGAGSHAKHYQVEYLRAYLDRNKRIPLGGDDFAADIKIKPEDYQLSIIDSSLSWVNFKGYWGLIFPIKQLGPRYRNPQDSKIAMWQNPLGWFEKYSE